MKQRSLLFRISVLAVTAAGLSGPCSLTPMNWDGEVAFSPKTKTFSLRLFTGSFSRRRLMSA